MDPEFAYALRNGAIFYIILAASVCLHEWGHAWMADKLGDPLPRAQGRVTLNPLAHMDFIGTFMLPMLMIFMPIAVSGGIGLALIGWGKPVQISLPNPKTRKRDDLLITAAGPLMNLMICFIAVVVGGGLLKLDPNFKELLIPIIFLNCTLFCFNLLPIPPLDGSHFAKHLFGMSEEFYFKLAQWGFVILIVLINIPVFNRMLFTAINILAGCFLLLQGMIWG